jgi:hypothetical protein
MTIAEAPRIRGFPRYNILNPFPSMLRRKMPYSARITLTSTVANTTGTQLSYQLNSLFEPEPGVSHQPYGFDQLCSATGPYTRYKVCGFKCKITATNTSASNTYPVFLCTQLNNVADTSGVGGVDLGFVAERPNVRVDAVSAYGSQSKTFTVSIPSLHPLYNWDKQTFDIDMGQTTGPYNASPGSVPDLSLAVANLGGDAGLYVVLEFEFDTIFYDRFVLPSS